MATTLAFGDASMTVQARRDISIGKVRSDAFAESQSERFGLDIDTTSHHARYFSPTLSSYGTSNALHLTSAGGDVDFGSAMPAPATYGQDRSSVARNSLPAADSGDRGAARRHHAEQRQLHRSGAFADRQPRSPGTGIDQVRLPRLPAMPMINIGVIAMLDIAPGPPVQSASPERFPGGHAGQRVLDDHDQPPGGARLQPRLRVGCQRTAAEPLHPACRSDAAALRRSGTGAHHRARGRHRLRPRLGARSAERRRSRPGRRPLCRTRSPKSMPGATSST